MGINTTTNAAVGPDILTLEPPVSAITIPAIMAVYNPIWGGTPVAMASAMERGNAMTPTVSPARMSDWIAANDGLVLNDSLNAENTFLIYSIIKLLVHHQARRRDNISMINQDVLCFFEIEQDFIMLKVITRK